MAGATTWSEFHSGRPQRTPGDTARCSRRARQVPAAIGLKNLRDLRMAEVVKLDLELDNGQVRAYRARVQISFKLEERT